MNELVLEKNSTLPVGWIKTTLREITQDIQKINPKEQPSKEFQYCDIDSVDNDRLQITTPKNFLGKNAPSRARQLIKKDDVSVFYFERDNKAKEHITTISQPVIEDDGRISHKPKGFFDEYSKQLDSLIK